MKNIAVLVHDDAGQQSRMQAALDITRMVGGHLIGVSITALFPVVDDPILAVPADIGLLSESAAAADNRVRIERRLTTEDVPWSIIDGSGDLAFCLTRHSALADLVVVNTAFGGFPGNEMSGIVASLIHHSRTVLAAPVGAAGIDLTRPVLIAWDGSDEAEMALRSAVPLIARAGTVHILSVNGRDAAYPASAAAAYLSRHGLHAEGMDVESEEDPGQVILDHVRSLDPALVVMGAYGHPRFVEALFGGVTRRMMEHSPVPLLLAH